MNKRLLLLLTVFTFCFGAFAQINCNTPISNSYFNTEYANINSMGNATSKINYATNFANNNCLYSNQIKQITMLFYNDQDKLTFAKAAYKNALDKDNFYDVYDAFAYFSNVFRLHDYVMAQRGQTTYTTTVVTNNTNTNTNSEYPTYTYPDFTTYFGITGCNLPIDENTFHNTYNSYRLSKMSENAKLIAIKDYINVTCLSTSQIMRMISILSAENYRLEALKSAYPRAYDRANFSYAEQLLTSQNYRLDFENFLKSNGTTTTIVTTNTNCSITATEMTDIKKSINASAFDNTKMGTAKQILAAKKCFTVAQIKEILALFSFEDAKLEIAKYAYDYCSDKSNYYQVNDIFVFSSNKDDLTKYVQSKQ
jgi:hypothetical protein